MTAKASKTLAFLSCNLRNCPWELQQDERSAGFIYGSVQEGCYFIKHAGDVRLKDTQVRCGNQRIYMMSKIVGGRVATRVEDHLAIASTRTRSQKSKKLTFVLTRDNSRLKWDNR